MDIIFILAFIVVMSIVTLLGVTLFKTLSVTKGMLEEIRQNTKLYSQIEKSLERNFQQLNKLEKSNEKSNGIHYNNVTSPISRKTTNIGAVHNENLSQISTRQNLSPEEIPDDLKKIQILKAQIRNDDSLKEVDPNAIVVSADTPQVCIDLITKIE